jgi:hypothetical protein
MERNSQRQWQRLQKKECQEKDSLQSSVQTWCTIRPTLAFWISATMFQQLRRRQEANKSAPKAECIKTLCLTTKELFIQLQGHVVDSLVVYVYLSKDEMDAIVDMHDFPDTMMKLKKYMLKGNPNSNEHIAYMRFRIGFDMKDGEMVEEVINKMNDFEWDTYVKTLAIQAPNVTEIGWVLPSHCNQGLDEYAKYLNGMIKAVWENKIMIKGILMKSKPLPAIAVTARSVGWDYKG